MVQNLTITNGHGLAAGGISNAGTLTVTNSTFSGNSVPSGVSAFGGAIENIELLCGAGNAPCPATLTNTIVANSSGGNCAGTITDGGHNLDDGTTCGFTGTGCTNSSGSSLCRTNPKLDPAGLADNGGPTQTIALQADSPAVNAGDESVCAAPPVNNLDQRGYVRPSHAQCSIGAYEADPTGPEVCSGDCDGSGDVTVNELITMVNIALGTANVTACTAGDANGDGEIAVNAIVAGVNSALNGCPTAVATEQW